jgi:pimeloyl-ACP methyl ester carboxylesterase
LADDVHALLDALHIKQAVICGYSNGGSIALEFALRYPHKVKMLIKTGKRLVRFPVKTMPSAFIVDLLFPASNP